MVGLHEEHRGIAHAGASAGLRVAITGARGFVGNCLVDHLRKTGVSVLEIGREVSSPNAEFHRIEGVSADTDYSEVLAECHVVVHLAARTHIMDDTVSDPLTAFRVVNTAGTLNLARQAAASGVRRFVFLSSIKVNGEVTSCRPFSEFDSANPEGPYAVSKWEAEQGLKEVAAETAMELVILRPTLVYGPGVKANFLKLLQLIDRGLPIPLGRVDNRRSMIFVRNLVDAVTVCLTHPNASGRTFLLSDGEDLATPELIRRLAAAMNRSAYLLPVPVGWIRSLGAFLRKEEAVERLLGTLTVDSHLIQRALGWRPPYSLKAGLEETAAWFRLQK